METLAYNPFPVSFIPSATLASFMHPSSSLSSLFHHEFSSSSSPPSPSSSSLSLQDTSSPVADISNTLNGITVSSPHQESPPSKKIPSPPSPSSPSSSSSSALISPRLLIKPQRRRNLSHSMDNFVNNNNNNNNNPSSSFSSSPSPPSSSVFVIPSPSPFSLSPPSPPSSPEEKEKKEKNEKDEKNENPCKSPKRAREEKEKNEEEEELKKGRPHSPTFQRALPSPSLSLPPLPYLPRSASTTHLDREGKQRARSLLLKSESFVRKEVSNNNCLLPTMRGPHPDLQYVSPQTVVDVLDGRYNNVMDEYHIIDCRFPYEYDGGHIKTALNLTENDIKQMFIDNSRHGKKVVLIFHCEFSSQRAPRCLRFLRELDRKVNIAEYPKLTYPDVYVIDGGFKNFFETFEDYCTGTYVEMRDERHFVEMKAHLRRFNFKRVRSMSADNTNMPFFQPIKLG